MSTGIFLLVFIALGFVVLAYFTRRSKNQAKRHPGEQNPIDFWLYGKSRKDDDED
ncbi:nucleoside transporter [Desulfolutivibrio sulfoxidireducens]|uniref:nucleoside transporter n=1 Tax=Desulfolutivibrio sulfoxidireducens TaxID=2773299 RepID=UPI00159D0C25|nr:nucleoside transporter [Desulfolutivibrio sulfoxidireducens]QLA15365.1 nucleoside transporter [Desulfolutivibrio sulfoxidireducens]QLA18944.1 nucleoside transporter [Desulfolutivibrio sulfoxidireducens]